MIFPPNHSEFPDQSKGNKAVLVEHGLWIVGLNMSCKKCEHEATICCTQRILEFQADFAKQYSLVQEVIKAVGHLFSKFRYVLLGCYEELFSRQL